jgi:Flp pilus assembly protein TadD
MQQKFENAINICKEAILLSPQDANIYMNMGIIYQQMGQGQASQEAFETAFKINPALRK